MTQRLAEHRPKKLLLPRRWSSTAAVAAVVSISRGTLKLLFIRRTTRKGDRWSGNVAFPGGLSRKGDADLASTARREAWEEVGISLDAPVAMLSELVTAFPGRFRPLRIVPYVFVCSNDVDLVADVREVAEAFWVPLADVARAPRVFRKMRVGPVPIVAPGVMVQGRFLWGLTYAMVREMVRVCR